jgi:hypothetical protein
MPVVTNIQRVIMPAATKGMPEVIDYVDQIPWSAGTDVVVLSDAGYLYTKVGANAAVMDVTVNATDLTISSSSSAADIDDFPATGYLMIETEVMYYSARSGVAGTFTIPSTASRGVLGTTAASHTATQDIKEILRGVISRIEYNTDSGFINVWSRTTQYTDTVAVTSIVLFSIPEDNISMIEIT